MQPLADLWKRPEAVDAVDARLRATVLRLSATALELVARVETAYARAARSARALELEEAAQDLVREQLQLLDQRLSQG